MSIYREHGRRGWRVFDNVSRHHDRTVAVLTRRQARQLEELIAGRRHAYIEWMRAQLEAEGTNVTTLEVERPDPPDVGTHRA